MTIGFERPKGSHLDLRELEYISALHQTGKDIRADASVTAEDIVHLLTSRHGIKADLQFVKERLMPDLAGALEYGEEEPVFDLVELVAILLIPHFLKAESKGTFQHVRDLIALDLSGGESDGEPLVLDRRFVRNLLSFYGETNVTDQAIDDMLKAAAGGNSEIPIAFTADTLLRATTSDVQEYNPSWDQSTSTHFDDVFEGSHLHFDPKHKGKDETLLDSTAQSCDFDAQEKKRTKLAPAMKRLSTLSGVDYVAENFRSINFTVVLWVTVILAYFSYIAEINLVLGHVECERFSSTIGCRITNAIIAWLTIFLQLSIIGTSFLLLSSASNSVYVRRNLYSFSHIVLGIATIVVSCICSYKYDISTFFANTERSEDAADGFLQVTTMVLGLILICFQVKVLLLATLPEAWYEHVAVVQRFLVSGMAQAEHRTKQAASWKIDRMVDNAIDLHLRGSITCNSVSSRNVSYGQAMLAYDAMVNEREHCGGIIWTLRKVWDGTIFTQEGVWLHARLIASNLSQWFVAAFYIILFFGVIYKSLNAEEDAPPTEAPSPTVSPAPTLDPLSAEADGYYLYAVPLILRLLADEDDSHRFAEFFWQKVGANATAHIGADLLDTSSNSTLRLVMQSLELSTLQEVVKEASEVLFQNKTRRLDEDDESFEEYITPELWMIKMAVSFGGLVAFGAAAALAIVWIPSAVSSVLRFRCGEIGSLHDKEFKRYRTAPDLTSILFGSCFWGSVLSSFYLFLITGGTVFLAVWEPSREFVLLLFSQIIGVSVTILAKILVLTFMRKVIFVGLYRKNPATCNVTMLILESWSLGLTVGTVLARLAKSIAVSAFYVGRLDTPLFAPGVGNVGPVPLDNYPIQFRKDLVVHDAHRHPYIERLGVIYMLKLRHGSGFASPAGSAWRLVFVMALMPWLRRFRLKENMEFRNNGDSDNSSKTSVDGKDATSNNNNSASSLLEQIKKLQARTLALEEENDSLRRRLDDCDASEEWV